MGFAEDIKRYQDTCEKNANARLRKIGIVALKKIVTRTPVKTGCARSNWNVSINKEDLSFNPEKKEVSGGGAINRGTPIVMRATLGNVINIVNTAPYITRLEHGYSRQQPGGFLRISQKEIQNYIDNGNL